MYPPSFMVKVLVFVSILFAELCKSHVTHTIEFESPGHLFRSRLPSLGEATIDEVQQLQAAGIISSVDLVKAFIHRIGEVNDALHAVSEINPDALAIARDLDGERKVGRVRGPLHGVPILVKDNIATLDRMNTTAGSFALLGATVSQESTVIAKLREAGAVILGKATTGEWGQLRSSFTGSSHGWSPLGGQTFGAYYPQQDPSGSSSGSAVAVALGLAIGALATETSGSILLPAEKGNIVGIKPTLGLVSRNMVIPISQRQDTVGSHARTVKDAAYLLSAISGVDEKDHATLARPDDGVPDYASACDSRAFTKARLGVPRNGIVPLLNASTHPVMEAFEEALDLMRKAGADVQDDTNFANFDVAAVGGNGSIVLDTDFASGLEKYLSKLAFNPNGIHNLHDLVHFTKNHPLEGWPDRNILVWERILDRNITSDSNESQAAYQANLRMAEEDGVLGVLDKYNLDALVMPTFASFHLPAIGGLPVVTVPMGFYPAETELVWNAKGNLVNIAPGIPFAISFVGRRWSEETLIALAYAFEQRTNSRRRVRPLRAPAFDLCDQVFYPHPTKAENSAVPSPEEKGPDVSRGSFSKAKAFYATRHDWVSGLYSRMKFLKAF